MEQSHTSEANSTLSEEIPHLYGTRRFIAVFNSPPLDPILRQMNPVRTLRDKTGDV
jgi:hypothetical protein